MKGSALKAMGGRLTAMVLSVLPTFTGHSHYHWEASGCKKLQILGGYLWVLKHTQPLCRAGWTCQGINPPKHDESVLADQHPTGGTTPRRSLHSPRDPR